jgi:hypothetical protein
VGGAGEVAVELQDFFRLRKGMEHRPRQHRADRMEAVLKGGHHAKVAPASADAPEELRVLSGAGNPQRAVGGDEIDGEQVVRGEPVFIPQPAGEVGLAWGVYLEQFQEQGHPPERARVRFSKVLTKGPRGWQVLLYHRDIQPFTDDGRYPRSLTVVSPTHEG